MATFTGDDKFYLQDQQTGERIRGEFSAVAAKARAVALSIESGHSIDVYVVGSQSALRGESVACADGGHFALYEPHDDDGNRLPFVPWPGDDNE